MEERADFSWKILWGRGLLSGGYVLLSMGLGMGIGYWAADLEIHWLPSMLRNILLLWLFGFGMLGLGAQLRAGSSDARHLRRRAAAFGSLAVVTGGAILLLVLLTRTTPLTAMAEAEYRYAHELDARYFRDLDRNMRGVVALLASQSDLFAGDPNRVLTGEEESLLLDAWTSYIDAALAVDQVRRFHEDFYRFDLSRTGRWRHTRSFLLSFAAELSLFENTTRLIELLDENENAVRFLNVARPERSIPADSVALMREELAGLTDLGRVEAGKQYLEHLESVYQARGDALANGYDWLWTEAEGYVTAVERRRHRDRVTMSVGSDFAPILRNLKHLTFPVQKGVAEWMGDVRVKRIGHYLITAEQAGTMEAQLGPGDVLLSRKNWYLSNIGLPGFWPHALLYVGTNEAIANTLDQDQAVRDWVSERLGREASFSEYLAETYPLAWRQRADQPPDRPPLSVIEAVSEGVIQNSLYGASGDFIVALRPRLPAVAKARAIDRAFSFLALPYDFDFDFATDQALVCTEVVWRSYRPSESIPGLDLPPLTVAGRQTLPANEIARRFKSDVQRDDAQFDFVYYLEGREREEMAVVADLEAFLKTPDRGKWDLDF